MSFDWWDYLALAENLCLTPDDEARARSAISRAYYACYQRARERVVKKYAVSPQPRPTAGLHQAMWNVYKNHADRTCQKIGIDGDRLRIARTKADYDAKIFNIPFELTAAMVKARQMKNDLSGLSNSLP